MASLLTEFLADAVVALAIALGVLFLLADLRAAFGSEPRTRRY